MDAYRFAGVTAIEFASERSRAADINFCVFERFGQPLALRWFSCAQATNRQRDYQLLLFNTDSNIVLHALPDDGACANLPKMQNELSCSQA